MMAAVIALATMVSNLSGRGYAMDTLLGVMAHASLAVGLVAVSFLDGIRIDLMAYLFGDILAVGKTDLGIIWGGALLVIALVVYRWSGLLLATMNADMAYASGISPKRGQLILTIALAIVVAVAIKVVGVLLIAAMLIIPAATARPFCKTPEAMAITAAIIGCTASLTGLSASYQFDTPTGPTIVCMVALMFAFSSIFWNLSERRRARSPKL